MIKDIKVCLFCKDLEDCKERLKKLKDTLQVVKKSEKMLTYCSNLEK